MLPKKAGRQLARSDRRDSNSKMQNKAADVIAFTDEAGQRGYVRGLRAPSDHLISLMCSLLIPIEHVEHVRRILTPGFDKFCAAAPAGAKLHITEAFKPGNEKWRAVAEEVRAGQFDIMRDNGIFLTFAARRFKVAREMFELLEKLKADAKAHQRSDYVVEGSNRPSSDQIDDDVMINLALMVDEFVETRGRQLADIYFDEIDESVANRYRKAISRTQNIERSGKIVKARNRVTGQRSAGKIEVNVESSINLNARHLGEVKIIGKNDPLVFATDVVTNSLWRHLDNLPPGTPLNERASVAGWEIPELTWVAPANSIFDKI